jgi:DNA-directed RNA polymerase sigma subunit (sigma70/sigma32)
MRGDGLLQCSRICLKKKKRCSKVGCKHFIDYKEEYNCSLISIHKNGRMTLREVGDRLRISFARVKQIESAALKKIKNTDLFYFKDLG